MFSVIFFTAVHFLVSMVEGNVFNHRQDQVNNKKDITFQPRETWIQDFCLLSNRNQSFTPIIQSLTDLKIAGLGRKHIAFPDKRASFVKVKGLLDKEFSKLASKDGAYELLRAQGSGQSRPMSLLPMPTSGYSVPHLKESISSSTLIYIRPMKSSLSMDMC